MVFSADFLAAVYTLVASALILPRLRPAFVLVIPEGTPDDAITERNTSTDVLGASEALDGPDSVTAEAAEDFGMVAGAESAEPVVVLPALVA
eukprot:m.292341 g.292341  ORF g.292341 m.292341 type:complete len:92 (-) comp19998_c0_seq3:450-725(-)